LLVPCPDVCCYLASGKSQARHGDHRSGHDIGTAACNQQFVNLLFVGRRVMIGASVVQAAQRLDQQFRESLAVRFLNTIQG